MADFHCPECGKALARKARKDGSGYFWSCTGYPDCKFIADDYKEEPYLHKCPECGKALHVRKSKKTGHPYIACFNEEGHKEGKALFFNERGELKTDNAPKGKGEFSCPECGGSLRYFRLKNGKNAGNMAWACFKNEDHANGKAKFFNDDDGRPVF